MIPRLVHQTWKDRNISSWIFRRSQASITTHLPAWQYRLWTDEDLDGLVKSRFPGYYDAWLGLNRPIKRVDTARYLILHEFGGLYADLDFIFTRNIDNIIGEPWDLFFYQSMEAVLSGWDFLGNAFMVSRPGQKFWLDVLEYMLGLPADTHVLFHTGPRALGAYYASLPVKPNVRIFGPDYFDNEECSHGVGERLYGHHIRTATWQYPTVSTG